MQRAVIFPSPRWRARMPRRCTQRLQEAKHACLKGCDQRCNDHKDAGPNLRAVGALETLQPNRLQSNLRSTATTAMSEQHILLPDGCASHSSEAVQHINQPSIYLSGFTLAFALTFGADLGFAAALQFFSASFRDFVRWCRLEWRFRLPTRPKTKSSGTLPRP